MVNAKDRIGNVGEERVWRDGEGGAVGALGLVGERTGVSEGGVLGGKIPSRRVGEGDVGVVRGWVVGWRYEGLAECSSGVEETGFCRCTSVAVVPIVGWWRIESRHSVCVCVVM